MKKLELIALKKDTVAIICDRPELETMSVGGLGSPEKTFLLNREKLIEFDNIDVYRDTVKNWDFSKQTMFDDKLDVVKGFDLVTQMD